jgi:hypothetical protein
MLAGIGVQPTLLVLFAGGLAGLGGFVAVALTARPIPRPE